MGSLRQQSSFGPGVYRGRKLDLERLRTFVDGTNKAIAAGIPIPLLKRHAPIDASDTATIQFAKEEGAGWVKQVGLDDKGAIWWEADGVPSDVHAAVDEKRTRFTSPEFRPVYKSEKAGVYTGPLIRHFAFSIKPGNPTQGPIESLALDESDTSWQFDESERKPLEEPNKGNNVTLNIRIVDDKPVVTQHDETPSDAARSRADSETPLEEKGEKEPALNPDLPPQATDRSKLSAVIAGLAQKNIVLPSDFDFTNDSAIDILIAALNSSIKAENEARAEAEPVDPDDAPVVDASMPFDETQQFGERSSLLAAHGYERDKVNSHPNKGYVSYNRKGVDRTGKKTFHTVTLYKKKKWGQGSSSGEGHESLASHLGKLHGSSQHSEQPTSLNGDSVMFTPEQLAKLPQDLRLVAEKQNAAIKEQNDKIVQFDEQRREALNANARDNAIALVQKAKIPPGLRDKLIGGYTPAKKGEEATIQFDEGEEQPTYTAVQVAEMVAAALPKNFQFNEKEAEEVEAPKGQILIGHDAKGNPVFRKSSTEQFFEGEADGVQAGHVSPEEAERLVAANPAFGGHARRGAARQSLSDEVADSARRHPSRMTR